MWPSGVIVGHTGAGGSSDDEKLVILEARRVHLTPAEARLVAQELLLRADFQERTPDTYVDNGVPRRKS